MVTAPLLIIGLVALFVIWVIEHLGSYLRWLIGVLISLLLLPLIGVAIILTYHLLLYL